MSLSLSSPPPAFAEVVETKANRHPFENMMAPVPPPDWLARQHSDTQHHRDVARSEEALLAPFGIDFSGVLRDWNEELQACRDLPRTSLQVVMWSKVACSSRATVECCSGPMRDGSLTAEATTCHEVHVVTAA